MSQFQANAGRPSRYLPGHPPARAATAPHQKYSGCNPSRQGPDSPWRSSSSSQGYSTRERASLFLHCATAKAVPAAIRQQGRHPCAAGTVPSAYDLLQSRQQSPSGKEPPTFQRHRKPGKESCLALRPPWLSAPSQQARNHGIPASRGRNSRVRHPRSR